MKMYLKKTLSTIVIALSLLSYSVYGEEQEIKADSSGYHIETAVGLIAKDLESMFNEIDNTDISDFSIDSDVYTQPVLEDVIISVNDNSFILTSTLVLEHNKIKFDGKGTLYTFKNGIYKDHLALVDIEDNNKVNIVQVRIEKDSENNSTSIKLTLQLLHTQELLHFQLPIETEVFNTILNNSIVYEKNEEDERNKLLDLLVLENNIINTESYKYNKNNKISITDSELEDEPTEVTTFINEYSEWRNLFRKLEDKGYAYLDDYNISWGLFNDRGYNHKVKSDNAVTTYVVNNGSNEKLVEITFSDLLIENYNKELTFQWDLAYGYVVSFNPNTERISVIEYGAPGKIYDLYMHIGYLNNNNIFNYRYTEYALGKSPNFINGFISLIPPKYQAAYYFMDELFFRENVGNRNTTKYDSTYSGQVNRYGDPIQGLTICSGNGYLNSTKHSMLLEGTVVSSSTNFSWKSKWEYTISSYLD